MATSARPLHRCDEADPSRGLRVDRATLRKGRRLDDGSWVREAVLARADVPMSYSWGTEVATEEALSDPAYLDGLRGLAVVAKHPRAQRVDITDPGTYDEVGTVLSARWDADDRTVVVELVIRQDAANRAIAGGQTGVSEGYAVPRIDATVQPARQLQRVPNHVALTLDGNPRMPGAHVRADHQETSMDPIALAALCAAFGLRTDSLEHLRLDLDALTQAKDAAEKRADEAEATVKTHEQRADAAEAGIDDAVTARVAEVVALRARADELGQDLPADDVDPVTLRRALAVALGGDAARCDASDDYAAAIVDTASKPGERWETRVDFAPAAKGGFGSTFFPTPQQ